MVNDPWAKIQLASPHIGSVFRRIIFLRRPNEGHGMASPRSWSVKPVAEEESVHEHVAERGQLCCQLSARQDRCRRKAAVHHSADQGYQRRVQSMDERHDNGGVTKAEEEAVTCKVLPAARDVEVVAHSTPTPETPPSPPSPPAQPPPGPDVVPPQIEDPPAPAHPNPIREPGAPSPPAAAFKWKERVFL
jgi:hypothetical protein